MRQVAKSSNYLYRSGYTMVSNLLFDYQKELNIDNDELLFVIKIYRHMDGYKLHDEDLDPTLSTRTLQRRRKSLKEKDLLDYKIYTKQNEDGSIYSYIIYDLSLLENKLAELSNLKDTQAEVVEEGLNKNGAKKVEEKDIKNPIVKFCSDYENVFSKKYRISKDEQKVLSQLDEQQKSAIGYIFDWYEFHKNTLEDLPKDCIPRLSFFFKVPFRFKSLMEFYYENSGDIPNNNIVEGEAEMEINHEETIINYQEFQEETKILYEFGIDPLKYYKAKLTTITEGSEEKYLWDGETEYNLKDLYKYWIPKEERIVKNDNNDLGTSIREMFGDLSEDGITQEEILEALDLKI